MSRAGDRGAGRETPVPWVSALLVAACLAVTLAARGAEQRALGEIDTALNEARAYLQRYPELEPGPLLTTRIGAGELARLRAEYAARQRREAAAQVPDGVRRRRQEKLDRTLERAVAALDAMPSRRWGFVSVQAEPRTYLSYALLHESLVQLAGNALLLLLLGVYLEPAWGRVLHALGAAAAAAGGALAFRCAVPDAQVPLVGSSALAAGLLAAFALRFRGERREGFYAVGVSGGAVWLALPAWLGAGWSLASGAGAPLASYVPPRAVLFALGGGVAGALALQALSAALRLEQRLGGGSGAGAGHPLYERALRERARGRPARALELLAELSRAEPENLDAALATWEIGSEIGRRAEASSALLRVVRDDVRHGREERAANHWLSLTAGGFPEEADPALLIRMALLLRGAGEGGAALDALRCALERSQGASASAVASRVARAARDLDPRTAEQAAWRALGSLDLGLKERQALEALLAEVIPPLSELRERARAPEPDQERTLAFTPEEEAPARPAPIELDSQERRLEVVSGVPIELDDEGVRISVDKSAKRVRYERIEAVAVAAVGGLAPKPVLLVDLVLNWMTTTDETLRVVRLRGDRFDPRRLVPGLESPVAALRRFVEIVLERSRAAPLPDADAARGQPFASFDALSIYHQTVLMVDDAGEGGSDKTS
jgi:membrane associated rhomboid family serine protease